MEQIACGQMGLTIDYFYSLLPRQFYNISIGHREQQENNFTQQAMLLRRVMWTNILPHVKKGVQLDETDLFPLAIDNVADDAKAVDETELQAVRDYWAEVDRKRALKQ